MNEAIIGLTICYVALAALLLGIFLFARISYGIKLFLVVLLSGFYYLNFHSINGILGWPTEQQLPERFQLLASMITEPDESSGEKGVIHIWVNGFENNFPAPEPRAYELPYDLDLHAALDDALREQRRGNVQMGRRLEEIDDPNMPKDSNRFGQKRQRLEFFNLPDPELPEK